MVERTPAQEIIRFRIVREPYGWAVRMGDGVMTPFHSRQLALEHAHGFADALRRRGECAEVICDEVSEGRVPAARRRTRFPSIRR